MNLAELVLEAVIRAAELKGERAAGFVHSCCAAPRVLQPPRFWKPRRGLLLLVLVDGVATWREPEGWRLEASPVAFGQARRMPAA